MYKLDELIRKKRKTIKFKIIDKLDLISNKRHIKNIHNYFYILNYIYDNIDFYYNLLCKIEKNDIDKERIKDFESLLSDMNIHWLINENIIIQDDEWISSIEKIDIYYLNEKNFI